MTQVVISDFDGTLCDTRAAIAAVLAETFRTQGHEAPASAEIDATLSEGITLEETFRRLRPQLDDAEHCAAWVKIYRKIYNDGLGVASSVAFHNVSVLLAELHKRDIPLVVVSNKGEEAVHNTLRFLGLNAYVHSVVAARGTLATKPDPQSFAARIRPLFPHLAPEHFLMLGDTSADINYAKAIGAPVAWVSYGYGDAAGCHALDPDYVIADPLEVIDIVARRSARRSHRAGRVMSLEQVDGFCAGSALQGPFQAFCDPAVMRTTAQAAIAALTRQLITAMQGALPAPDLLAPVARAGMAMFETANQAYGAPNVCFVVGTKIKGTQEAVTQLSSSPPAAARILILDTVIATGDTVLSAARQFNARYPLADIMVASCYAAPQAIERLLASDLIQAVAVAVRSTGCADGWLIPKINGDAGEKLYGVTPGRSQ